jgi:hypothetical protein
MLYGFFERLRSIKYTTDPAPGNEALFITFTNTHIFLIFHQRMRITYRCGLRLLYIRHSIYSTVENKEMIFQAIKK